MARRLRQLRREDYTVGWVCPLPIELAAAHGMLDEEHSRPRYDTYDTNGYTYDTNDYTYGRVGEHNVVIASLPAGQTGTNSAAAVAVQMKSTFASMQLGLMVGIGGGVPSKEADVRLGDVVVSEPHKTYGGVVQYDFGKATLNGFERTGVLNTPPRVLLNAVTKLQARHARGEGRFSECLSKLDRLPNFARKEAGPDALYNATYDHREGTACEQCDASYLVAREPRRQDVMVHYGTIASGNQVMRSAAERDRISAELGGVLCFEMEAAGLMNSFPCLVIRGICDYADSHKNKKWQPYAAATAAAYAKDVMLVIEPVGVVDYPLNQKVIADQRHGLNHTRNGFSFANSRHQSHGYIDTAMLQALYNELREQDQCFQCGTPCHWRDECYASEKTIRKFRWDYDLCLRCGFPGHVAREC